MGTHLKVLSESFTMNTNIRGFRIFLYLHYFAMDGMSISIGKVNANLLQNGYRIALLEEFHTRHRLTDTSKTLNIIYL